MHPVTRAPTYVHWYAHITYVPAQHFHIASSYFPRPADASLPPMYTGSMYTLYTYVYLPLLPMGPFVLNAALSQN
jgi:hypothetical protein